jgi:hypothetical protein
MLHQPGADATFDIGSTAVLQDDRIDAFKVKEM